MAPADQLAFTMPTLVAAAGFTAVIAGLGIWRRWLTNLGAISAAPVGVAISLAGWDCAAMLFLFFVSGSLATKFNARALRLRRVAKAREATANPDMSVAARPDVMPTDNDAKVGRGALQVLATAGIPALLCAVRAPEPGWYDAVLVYFACCAGDTFASEFGQLSRSRPRLITTFETVTAGQDGGVSLLGTAASALGGALIGAVGGTWATVALGAFSGWAGSMIDSLLGALLQAPGAAGAMDKPAWKAWNCAVNALSSAMTVLLVAFCRAFSPVFWAVIALLSVVTLGTANAFSVLKKR